MGVKDLWQLISPIGRRVSIETLEGKTLAIDASIWITQFLKAMRDEDGKMIKNAHLIGTLRRILKLLHHKIRPLFVFDGQTPILKYNTLKLRRKNTEKQEISKQIAAQRILRAQLKQYILKNMMLANESRPELSNDNSTNVNKKDNNTNSGNTNIDNNQYASTFRQPSMINKDSSTTTIINNNINYIQNNFNNDVVYQDNIDTSMKNTMDNTIQHDNNINRNVKSPNSNNNFYNHHKLDNHKSNLDKNNSIDDVIWEDGYENLYEKDFHHSEDESELLLPHRNSRKLLKRRKVSLEDTEIEEEDEMEWDLPEDVTTLDVHSLASLPSYIRKSIVEDIRRKRRMVSREHYLPVAANPELYSQTQLANFLHTSKLNSKFFEAQKESDGQNKGIRIAAEGHKMYRMVPISEMVSAISTTNTTSSNDIYDETSKPQYNSSMRSTYSNTTQTALINNNISSSNTMKSRSIIKIDEDEEEKELYIMNSRLNHKDSSNNAQINNTSASYEPMIVIDKSNMRQNDINTAQIVPINNNKISDDDDLNDVIWESDRSSTTSETDEIVLDKVDSSNISSTTTNNHTTSIINTTCNSISSSIIVNTTTNNNTNNNNTSNSNNNNTNSNNILSPEVINRAMTTASSMADWAGRAVRNAFKQHTSNKVHFNTTTTTTTNNNISIIRNNSTNIDSSTISTIMNNNNTCANISTDSSTNTTSFKVLVEKDSYLPNKNMLCDEDNLINAKNDIVSTNIINDSNKNNVNINNSNIDYGNKNNISNSTNTEDIMSPQTIAMDSNNSHLLHLDHSESMHIQTNPSSIIHHEQQQQQEQPQYNHNSFIMHSEELYTIDDLSIQKQQQHDYEGQLEKEYVEEHKAKKAYTNALRDVESLTEEMKIEVMELLQAFSIPYIIAPYEAEAQCAVLEQLGLVDGVVTEDSDAFLFGAKAVYKNIFNDKKFVEVYLAEDAKNEMGLSRQDLIALAYFLGVHGIGIVNAMEIIQAFSSASTKTSVTLQDNNNNNNNSITSSTITTSNHQYEVAEANLITSDALPTATEDILVTIEESLQRFKKWLHGYDFTSEILLLQNTLTTTTNNNNATNNNNTTKNNTTTATTNSSLLTKNTTTSSSSDNEQGELTSEQKKLLQFQSKHMSGRSKWQVSDSFPNMMVAQAYLTPEANRNPERFSWISPLRSTVRDYCYRIFGYTTQQMDLLIDPVLKRYSERSFQPRIDSHFLTYQTNTRFACIASGRLKEAVIQITGNNNLPIIPSINSRQNNSNKVETAQINDIDKKKNKKNLKNLKKFKL